MNKVLPIVAAAMLLAACDGCSDSTEPGADMAPDARLEYRPDMSEESDQGGASDLGSAADMVARPDFGDCDSIMLEHDPVTEHTIDTPLSIGVAVVPGADSVTLHWQKAGVDVAFMPVPMTLEGATWTGTILAEQLTFAKVAYWLEVTAGDCVKTFPDNGPDNPQEIDIVGEYRLTGFGEYQYRPDVDGHRVVWALDRAEGAFDDIVMFDLHTMNSFKVTDDSRGQGAPRISGRNVVFPDRYDDVDIALYDVETQMAHVVADANDDQYGLEIDGRMIVWTDRRNTTTTDIYGYDLGADGIFGTTDDWGEIELVRRGRDQREPSVSIGDDNVIRVVYASMWDDTDGVCDANCDWNIYLIDSGPDGQWDTADDREPTQLTSELNEQTGPVISGTRVVWLDARGGNWLDPDIWFMDLGPDGVPGTADDTPETMLDLPVNDPDALALWGDRLVWHDYRTGGYEVYRWDFATSTEQQITDVMNGQFYAEVFDNVTVWQDTRNNGEMQFYDDIYVRVLPSSL